MKKLGLILIFSGVILLTGCGSFSRYLPPQAVPDDRENIPEPEEKEFSLVQDAFQYSVVVPTERFFDLSRHLKSIVGQPQQALNVDAFGEVADSSWFINRNARNKLTLEEIARGTNQGTGPDTSGPWKIISAKVEGVSPGFNISDSRGDTYLIKFDPTGYVELSSGAEVIVTKLFYGAGYNVPENYIVYFNPDILITGEKCILYDEVGRACELTADEYERLMKKVDRLPDGRIRALASKYLDGKPLGPFRYTGTRNDDPNDIIPHEHRRELRGLYVLCAWLKHFDIKNANSLDIFVDENEHKYIKHYLIDFGSSLGSTVEGPMAAFRGHETIIDANAAFRNLLTLGLSVPAWEKIGPYPFPSIGRYDYIDFNPGNTIMNYPNPAINNRTNLDCLWGAKLVMSFTDEQLAAIVKEGKYSDPAAAAFLLKTLMIRRDQTGRYWYSKVNPLDDFHFGKLPSGKSALFFTDLGIEGKLWSFEQTRYKYRFKLNDKIIQDTSYLVDSPLSIPTEKLETWVQNIKGNNFFSDDDQWQIILWESRDYGRTWSKWVKVFFSRESGSGQFILLGEKREN